MAKMMAADDFITIAVYTVSESESETLEQRHKTKPRKKMDTKPKMRTKTSDPGHQTPVSALPPEVSELRKMMKEFALMREEARTEAKNNRGGGRKSLWKACVSRCTQRITNMAISKMPKTKMLSPPTRDEEDKDENNWDEEE